MKISSNTTSGIALIATILILAMCFSSLLTVLSLTSLSLKRGGKTQYHSYQALLAAESGINSFAARTSNNLFDSSKSDLSLDGLNQWLKSNQLDELSLLEGNDNILNTLRFSQLTPQSATLESIGTVQSTLENGEITALSKKVLRVDFKLYAAGSQLRIQTNAALTSLGDIHLNGNAQLTGATPQDSSGLIRDYDQARANPTPLPNSKKFQLRVQHPNRFHSGQYIELDSGRYKVTTVDHSANSLELLAILPKSKELFNPDEIALIPLALNAELPQSQNLIIELPITGSQTQSLVVGQNIAVSGYAASIESIGENTVTIRWTNSIANQSLAEGSLISLGTLSARASNEIHQSANATFTGGKQEQASITTSNIFEQSFGLSKDDLLGSPNNYNQRSGKNFDFHTASELTAITKLEGLYYIEDSIQFTASQPLCGSAIVIVASDVSVNSVCDEGFSGLLYVFGNYSQTSGHIDGAVVREGTSLSSAQTHLSGQASISYNSTALNQWQAYLQDALARNDGKQNFQQIAGSWRLE